MDAVMCWDLKLVNHKLDDYKYISSSQDDLRILIKRSPDWILGFTVGKLLKLDGSTIIVDLNYLGLSNDFIVGLKESGKISVIKIIADGEYQWQNTLVLSDYESDRQFKLDLIKAIAGREIGYVFGNHCYCYTMDHNCKYVQFPTPGKFPALEDAKLYHVTPGIVVIVGSPTDKLDYTYEISGIVDMINERNAINSDEQCRLWCMTFYD